MFRNPGCDLYGLADLSYRQLVWCTTWYLREETLQPAIANIVNHHYRHPLARLWGGGTLSSSDGQRFPVAVRSQTATAIPHYYGFGTGLTFYTWTSDQSSQYGSKPIPSTVRDSTYVLDGVLDNETELPIAEHTTDTAGYTDLVFGFFDLLGLQFSPRLRDLADQTLYRIDKSIRYQHIDLLVRGAIKPRLFLAHWDDLLRAAGSLKLGWVTASLFIAKLQSARRKNVLTRALQEYGRLNKTIFILRYLLTEQVQRRIGTQINKGEALHALRGFLFLANEAKIRRRHYEEQLNQASCLNLVTNAVVLWNTVYMSAVLDQLKAQGYRVDVRLVLGKEFYQMFRWFNQEGLKTDIRELRRRYPEVRLQTLEQWVRSEGWDKRARRVRPPTASRGWLRSLPRRLRSDSAAASFLAQSPAKSHSEVNLKGIVVFRVRAGLHRTAGPDRRPEPRVTS